MMDWVRQYICYYGDYNFFVWLYRKIKYSDNFVQFLYRIFEDIMFGDILSLIKWQWLDKFFSLGKGEN